MKKEINMLVCDHCRDTNKPAKRVGVSVYHIHPAIENSRQLLLSSPQPNDSKRLDLCVTCATALCKEFIETLDYYNQPQPPVT